MGLDVYVGPLSRYYAGSWETIVQQIGRQTGLNVEVIRLPQSKPGLLSRLVDRVIRRSPPDPVTLVRAWQTSLRHYAPSGVEFDWSDRPDGQYFTDKPAWDCYGALMLWAAYDETPPSSRRATAEETWSSDATYLASMKNERSRYRHLIANTELWLPIEFDLPFSAAMPFGDPAVIGSSIRLLSELHDLNDRTWRATPAEIDEWRREGAPYRAPLEKSAQMGFAVFRELAGKSVEFRLPMKLDY